MIYTLITIFSIGNITYNTKKLQKTSSIDTYLLKNSIEKLMVILTESLQHALAFVMQFISNSYDYMKKLTIIFILILNTIKSQFMVLSNIRPEF